MTSLQNKVAVVLGASARNGIGWACAERLASEGAKVVVAARSFERLKSLAEPAGMFAVQCDATKKQDIARLAEIALEQFGRVDIAVNSAGSGDICNIADATDELLQRSIAINYLPMVNFVQIMAKAMQPRQNLTDGSIILVSTLSVEHPMPGVFSYSAAKAATDALVRYAALEYGPQKIKINTINPGLVVTDLLRHSGIENIEAVEALAASAAALGRLATPSDCADAVYWLASSGFVTGTHLKVCGGAQIRPQFG